MTFFEMLWKSVLENWYIFVAAIFACVTLYFSRKFAKAVEKFSEEGAKKLKEHDYYLLDRVYTLFVTIISIFPLLGMLGTVLALLGLDLTGEMSELKANFFKALSSTAWGIIFAIIFKVINSVIQPFIENQIAKAKDILKIPR